MGIAHMIIDVNMKASVVLIRLLNYQKQIDQIPVVQRMYHGYFKSQYLLTVQAPCIIEDRLGAKHAEKVLRAPDLDIKENQDEV